MDSAEKVPLSRSSLRKRLVFSVAGSWSSRLQGLSTYPYFQRHRSHDVLPTLKALNMIAQGKHGATLGLHVRNHRTLKEFHIVHRRPVQPLQGWISSRLVTQGGAIGRQ